MINEIFGVATGMISSCFEYFEKALKTIEPLWVIVATFIGWILFPETYYIQAATVLGIAMVVDIATKFYSIMVKNGGPLKAIKAGKLTSDSLWRGSIKKAVGYFTVMILAGLSARISIITSVALFSSSVLYLIMFLREGISIIENMTEAGHDLGWLLKIFKRKKEEIESNAVDSVDSKEINKVDNDDVDLESRV